MAHRHRDLEHTERIGGGACSTVQAQIERAVRAAHDLDVAPRDAVEIERLLRGFLRRERKWSDAIDEFKAAELLEHRTIHACLIMLAYTRREAWAQAEVFRSLCLVPTPGESLPDWVGDAERLIDDRLRSELLAPVTIEVKPIDAKVTLTASSFEPDETFGPRTLHLSRGRHLIVARAPGFPDQQRA